MIDHFARARLRQRVLALYAANMALALLAVVMNCLAIGLPW